MMSQGVGTLNRRVEQDHSPSQVRDRGREPACIVTTGP